MEHFRLIQQQVSFSVLTHFLYLMWLLLFLTNTIVEPCIEKLSCNQSFKRTDFHFFVYFWLSSLDEIIIFRFDFESCYFVKTRKQVFFLYSFSSFISPTESLLVSHKHRSKKVEDQ